MHIRTRYRIFILITALCLLSIPILHQDLHPVYASSTLTTDAVPRNTSLQAVAGMKAGTSDNVIYAYGQHYLNGDFEPHQGSGCGYCCAATVSGIYMKKQITPSDIVSLIKPSDTEVLDFKGMAKVFDNYNIKYHYHQSFDSEDECLDTILSAVKSNRPVIVLTYGKWASAGYHFVTLLGITEDNRIIVADSMDRDWDEGYSRFKITTWDEIKDCIHIQNHGKSVYTSYDMMPEDWNITSLDSPQVGSALIMDEPIPTT